MRVYVRVLVLLAAVLLLAGTVVASEDNWRLTIRADDGAGSTSSAVTVGVFSTGSTGGFAFPSPPPTAVIAIADGTNLAGSKILPNTSPYPRIWNLRVGGYGMSQTLMIRLRVSTISGTALPPETVLGNMPARYAFRMVDNRGVEGAPANGTEWQLPVPAVHSTTPYFTLTIPWLGLPAGNGSALLSEGYKMEFVQEAVPEPSSLMALGIGLTGLLAFRRRR